LVATVTVDNRTIAEEDLVYTAKLQSVGYTYAGWDDDGQTYDKIGFLASEYVPIDQDPGILSKLILDSDDKYTLRTGQTLELGEGFAITPKQIDVDGNKVWLELSKDGEFIDDEVFNTLDNTDETAWEYDTTIGGEEDIVMLRVHINEVFQDQVDSLAIIEGVWLISDEVTEIDTSDTFGDLEVSSITTGPSGTITMDNIDNEISLNKDSTVEIAEGLNFRVADSENDDVRFYPFINYDVIIENEIPTANISSILPNIADVGDLVTFTFSGTGTDTDGSITAYLWTSDLDGQLSTSENFSTSGLSLGTHKIYLSVQDNLGAWSDTVSRTLEVVDNQAPEVHISAYPLEYISIYNPVTINLNSTDAHLASTEFIIADSEGHDIINLTITKDDPTSATYEYAWNATFSNETAVPSGTYLLFVNSTDTSGNEASASVSVTVDNRAPLLYIIGSEYDATHGMVNISASEPLNGTPEVEVNSESISVTLNDHGWSGIFNLNSNDVFAINVTAYDFAGNVGVGNSTIHIETIETANNTAVFNSSDSGISIIFRTTNEINSTVIVTESDQPMANITNGYVGIYFIDVDLGSGLESNFSNATIMIPINETKLPSGISENDVAIYYYNETNDNWEPIDTSVELIDGIKYWVTHVDHFSIYAAIAEITSGSGATGEAFENIAFKEVKTENIIGGLEISYTFDEEQNAIQYINFSALRNYGRVSTTVEVLKNRSAMVDESAPGVVYSNLNIWVGRAGFATEDNIDDSAIGFSVAKAWLIENGIDENSIALYRHSEGKWNALNTMKVGEDDSYIYFETETPGFSPFAIVGFAEEDESVSIEDITPSSEEDISEVEDEDTQTEPKGIPWISTGSLILILVGVHLLMRKRS
jgi:S-layer protein (TIGR01567 family)